MFQSHICYYVRIKEYIVSTQEMCLEKTYQDIPRPMFKILANKSRRTKTDVARQKLENLSQMTRFLCMHKILCMHSTLVHAQHSCACPGRLIFVWVPALGPGPSSACTRVLCMHKNLVHAQESYIIIYYNIIISHYSIIILLHGFLRKHMIIYF